MKKVMNYQDLRALGYPQNQARRIIRQAKRNLVKQGFPFIMVNELVLYQQLPLLKLSPFQSWRTVSNEVNEN